MMFHCSTANKPYVGGTMHLLLVDDNDIILSIEENILKSMGNTVFSVSNGIDAVSAISSQDFDMIFLDLNMPQMDGFETAREIRKKLQNVPIIALTADNTDELQEKIKISGINDCTSKPIRKEELSKFLEKSTKEKRMPLECIRMPSSELLDLSACLHTLNDKRALERLISRFLEQHHDDCNQINQEIQKNNWKQAKYLLHDIMGISGFLGCKKLYEAACDLYDDCKKEQSHALEKFCFIWDRTICCLEEIKNTFCETKETHSKKSNTTQSDMILQRFLILCDDFDVAAVDYFEDNKFIFENSLTGSVYQKLYDAIHNYDFSWILNNISM